MIDPPSKIWVSIYLQYLSRWIDNCAAIRIHSVGHLSAYLLTYLQYVLTRYLRSGKRILKSDAFYPTYLVIFNSETICTTVSTVVIVQYTSSRVYTVCYLDELCQSVITVDYYKLLFVCIFSTSELSSIILIDISLSNFVTLKWAIKHTYTKFNFLILMIMTIINFQYRQEKSNWQTEKVVMQTKFK